MVESVAERDAEQGLEFFEQLPSAERREVTDALVRSLAQSDFGQARQWFASVPEADRGVDGYKALTSEWVKRDSMAASEWVGGLQPGTERDGAAVALVGELIFGNTPDLDSAMEWAESIGDQGQRDSWLRTVFVRMVSENPEAGRKALRASSLSEDAKRTLLEP